MRDDAPLTRNEDLVLSALRGGASPQTAYQLLDRLRGEGLKAPLQIYRALRSLSDRHLVHRLESLNAFVACCHDHGESRGTIVFAICDDCGIVAELTDALLDERVSTVASRDGFLPNVATIEVRGRCQDCQEAVRASDS